MTLLLIALPVLLALTAFSLAARSTAGAGRDLTHARVAIPQKARAALH